MEDFRKPIFENYYKIEDKQKFFNILSTYLTDYSLKNIKDFFKEKKDTIPSGKEVLEITQNFLKMEKKYTYYS